MGEGQRAFHRRKTTIPKGSSDCSETDVRCIESIGKAIGKAIGNNQSAIRFDYHSYLGLPSIPFPKDLYFVGFVNGSLRAL